MKRKDILSLYPKEKGNYVIEMKLKSSGQLFNTFDPAPFHDKDLDEDAEEYIVESARELQGVTSMILRIHLPPTEINEEREEEIRDALKNYFHYRARVIAGQLQEKLGSARTGLAIGVAFLALSVLARKAFITIENNFFFEMLQEGLMILGWVSMWAPVQGFLYDWWPIRKKYRLYMRISEMEIEFHRLVLPERQ